MGPDGYADGDVPPRRQAQPGRTVHAPRGGDRGAPPQLPGPRQPSTAERSRSRTPDKPPRPAPLPESPGAPPGSAARPGPPGSGHPPAGRRRRWLFALLAIVLLLGAVAVVVVLDRRGGGGLGGNPQANPSGGPQTAGQPGSDPSGVAGLGPDPSLSATATPPAGFQPFPAPRKTLPGASLHIQDGESFADALRRSDRTFGPLRMVRVFYPGLPPAWNGSRADVTDRTVVVSFKAPPRQVAAGTYDSRLTAWFRSVPRNVDVYWSYFHEPENDVQDGAYTPAEFAAAFRHVAELADGVRNPRLRSTLILMCWTLSPNSGRDFDAYYPGAAAVDVLGWDCYNSGAKKDRYTPPDQVFSRMIEKSRALGKPWGLAETGSVRVAGDGDGARRAAWLRSMSEYLNEQRPLWVAYYDYQVSGGDYRLTDAPSRQAWKAWCAAAPA